MNGKNNFFNIEKGTWVGLEGKLNGGFTRGELTTICGYPTQSTFSTTTAIMLVDAAMRFPPSTPERYDAVVRYLKYSKVFIVAQEAPGMRPSVSWIDLEGGMEDTGKHIEWLLDGTRPDTRKVTTEMAHEFLEVLKKAKVGGTVAVIDSITVH